MPWTSVLITRDELYHDVWEAPVLQVAGRYQISSVALSKICRKLGVPIPWRGFWARVAAGEVPSPTPLPPPKSEAPLWHELRRWVSPVEDEDFGDDAQALLDPKRSPLADVDVADEPGEIHALLQTYKRLLRRNQKSLDDAFFLAHQCLDIRAQGDALERAARVMNAVFFALERNGFEIVVTAPTSTGPDRWGRSSTKPSVTGARILGSLVTFRIQEQHDSVRVDRATGDARKGGAIRSRTRPEYVRRPNGCLALKITNHNRIAQRVTWSDGRAARVETCVPQFVRALIAVAASFRAERRAEDREREAQALEAERRAREEREQERQEALRNDLRERIDQWKRAEEIRKFAQVVEAEARVSGGVLANDAPLSRWLTWIRAEADRVEQSAVSFVDEVQRIDPVGSPFR